MNSLCRSLVGAVAISLLLGLPTIGLTQEQVSSSTFGDDWPFPFERAIVTCAPPGNSVVLKADGKTYVLNGKARGQADARGYLDHQDLLPRDEYGAFTKGVSTVSALIDRGLRQCR